MLGFLGTTVSLHTKQPSNIDFQNISKDSNFKIKHASLPVFYFRDSNAIDEHLLGGKLSR